ncbi:kinase suppressor of Ras 1-like isoform X2 [Eucyclogobius newberryi]|uniref:kinase suppressor of Ras 1-like isoform X2 n=1 Tax=Eucyclogobius newberryi TaxID=166745 RepID=UPI003B5A886A
MTSEASAGLVGAAGEVPRPLEPDMRRLSSEDRLTAALSCHKSRTDSGCEASGSSSGSERQGSVVSSSSMASVSSKEGGPFPPLTPLTPPTLRGLSPFPHGRSISISVVPCSAPAPRGEELQDAFSPDSDSPSPLVPPGHLTQTGRGAKASQTPPMSRKLLQLFPNFQTLSRSKSHESQLANRIEEPQNPKASKIRPVAALQLNGCGTTSDEPRSPLYTRTPGPYYQPDSSSQHKGSHHSLGRDLGLTVNHRFSTKSWFSQTCQVCHKSVMFGVKCKHCKLKCHNRCSKDAPTCRISFLTLPQMRRAESVPSDINNRIDRAVELPVHFGTLPKAVVRRDLPLASSHLDSSSNASSATSSAPSSPHYHQNSPHSATPPNASPGHASRDQRFNFPELPEPAAALNSAHFTSGASAADVTAEAPEQGEAEESSEPVDPEQSEDLDEDGLDELPPTRRRFGGNIHRKASQTSVYLQEWNIPYEQLQLEELVGKGRWGKVHRGRWHGEVAIRLVEVDGNNEEHLKVFKKEVMNYRQTRHDNVILFMGACMAPPHLAIITSFCRGVTLHTVVRERASLLDNNKTKQIAQDIVNGMSYLHAKGIVHKDLKSQNIFYDTNKVVITDFGLFGMSGVVQQGRRKGVLRIPRGWLFYLAPEIVRRMSPDEGEDQLPFSKEADVYAFGTIWYELHSRLWPLENLALEARLWLFGSGEGIRQELSQAQLGKEVTDILSSCWSFHSSHRPSFSHLSDALEKLPKLNRRLSHPGHFRKTQDRLQKAVGPSPVLPGRSR